jgi:hypothetical protein
MKGDEKMQEKLYHYTVADYLPAIFDSGKIKPAKAFLPKNARPAVWFSTNPVWEETANKMYMDENDRLHLGTKETTHILGGGLARIEIDPEAAPYTWADYRRKSREGERYLDALEKNAGNPEEWRLSYKSIHRKKWKSVQVWDSIKDEWIERR